jgi:HEAT repeat protein
MNVQWPEDPRGTEELVAAALEGEEDDESAWEAVGALQRRGTREVLEAAARLLESPLPRARRRGADLLGQLGLPERTFPEECVRLLLDVLRRESEPSVLQAVAVALGHLRAARAVPELVKLKGHASEEVRFGVVHGLAGQELPEALAALIELSADSSEDVRNWATFELGSMTEVDTPELREALLRRLTDGNEEVRGEALVGLARRKDARVLEPLMTALRAPTVMVLVVEAAQALEDRRLYPLLLQLRDKEGEADAYFRSVLDDAIRGYASPPTEG